MKMFEKFINRNNNEKDFYCEVILKYSYMTEEIKQLIQEIDSAHKKCFSNEYKILKIEESNNTTFKIVE